MKEKEQISKMMKTAESKLKSEVKVLNKKIKNLNKTNEELSTDLSNQTAITDLCLEDSNGFRQEIQQHLNEIKMLKSLLHYYNPHTSIIDDRYIVIDHHNDDIGYKINYCDLICQLKELFECPLSLERLVNPVILPSGKTINESCFNQLVDSRDPFNKEFVVKHKIHNRFAREVKEIIEASDSKLLEQQQIYQNLKPLLNIDIQGRSKDTQTDFVVRSEEDIATINQISSLLEDFKADGLRNKQIIEKLKEELECAEKVKATAIEMLEAEQRKKDVKNISNNLIMKEDKSQMCDLCCIYDDINEDFMNESQSEFLKGQNINYQDYNSKKCKFIN